MTRSFALASLLAIFAALTTQVGCNKPTLDPALLAKHKQKFTLAAEPDGVQTVYEVREFLIHGENPDHDHEDHDHAGETAEEHATHTDEAEHTENHAAEADFDHDHSGETAEEHAAHEHDHDHAHDHAHVGPTEAKEVAMVGQIGGLANPWEETQPEFPFSTKFAIFFLADPQAVAEHAESGHVHAPGEECAFCAAHAEENSELFAMVRLLDQNGKPISVDSREMFDLKEGDTVVVKGMAQIVEGGMLVMKADGLYVRK